MVAKTMSKINKTNNALRNYPKCVACFFILEGLLISNLLFLDTIYMPKKSITKSIMQCQLLIRF